MDSSHHRKVLRASASRVARCAAASAIALFTSVAAFVLLFEMDVRTSACSVAAFLAGAISNWMNRRWVWKIPAERAFLREFSAYLALGSIALAASATATGLVLGWAKTNVSPGHGDRMLLVTLAYVLVQAVVFLPKFVVHERVADASHEP
jgi:putative flippase GtrA